MVDFVGHVTKDIQDDVDRKAGLALPADIDRAVSRRGRVRLRLRSGCDRSVLLPRGSEGLSRPWILRRARPALRRARRFRTGVRHRSRVRSSRAEHPGFERACGGRPAVGRRQRLGCARTAGGLLCGRLGPRRVAARARRGRQGGAGSGRRRRGAARGRGHRRRPPAEDEHRPGHARSLHPRVVRAARRVVPARDGNRRPALVRRIERRRRTSDSSWRRSRRARVRSAARWRQMSRHAVASASPDAAPAQSV